MKYGLTMCGLAIVATVFVLCPACTKPEASPQAEATSEPATTVSVEPIVYHVTVTGMHCNGCVTAVTDAVAKVDGVTSCEVSLEKGSAVVTATNPDLEATILEKISALGYEVSAGAPEALTEPAEGPSDLTPPV